MRRLFCRFFILQEVIFADQGQSAKSAKIRTRKIFMPHGKSVKSKSNEGHYYQSSTVQLLLKKLQSKNKIYKTSEKEHLKGISAIKRS